tara:strand:+ start:155 stop:598 length:444 start_codon:yes stop_codon:yes gene_type:complete
LTRIDFYVLDNPNERQYRHLICRLTQKAWEEGRTVHIRCEDAESSTTLDDLLWTYKDTSFLPHAVQSLGDATPVPVTLGHDLQIPNTTDVLINLALDIPDYFSRFDRLMETTGYDQNAREAARERYRFYKERGYELNTHKLDTHNGR